MAAIDGMTVARALSSVLERAAAAAKNAGRTKMARLVAVSKTKPVEMLKEAYDVGHRDFGENYVQELLAKTPCMPTDTRWHFIGHLQSNKVKSLLEGCPHLALLETVDSAKLATKLNNAVGTMDRPALPVFVQVNTSGEESKYGVTPDEVVELARHVKADCPHLLLAGLMTIGQPDYSSRPENFDCLTECRNAVAAALELNAESLELSMGMTQDFEQAIAMGSTNIRVGSAIFGARDYSKT